MALVIVRNCMPPIISFFGELVSIAVVWLKLGWGGGLLAASINLGVFAAFVFLLTKCQPGSARVMLLTTRDLFMIIYFLLPAVLLFLGVARLAYYLGS